MSFYYFCNMERMTESKNKRKNETFVSDYKKIVKNSENSVIVETEWTKKGDYFKKLSMYDNSYAPVQSLGNTTLIKAL